ncbi:transposase [Bradyrhizobium sp. 6(2017)]|uniref:transposase n=1 Tax=Bradyrhizobium sp. 6(2017) TaxID=1197460 RepID=UPI0013E150DD|nr:transposase [Bradyrhizobium sp. 6(2017)]QIG92457.1 transposase [Bradyrhizobium sp. 6(2017)]
MNVLSRDQQILIVACLTEGQSIRAIERLTGIHRDTIMRLGERVGRGCEELHDRMMVGIRCGRLELDEIWGYVGKKQKRVERHEINHKGDQYTFIGLASSAKAIISYRTGKRDTENTDLFVQDLRQRVIGAPEISTDGFHPYKMAIRDAFNGRAHHGVIVKTYSVTNLAVKEAARRYSPAEVVAVSREVESGTPGHISTSYVERQNLTLRMTQKRFARLTNGFSKKLTNHAAAVSLYVSHYNLCRVHEALRTTPAVALGIAERVWTIGDLLDAVLPLEPNRPVRVTRNFRIIDGGKK